jgi:hypothetical protein
MSATKLQALIAAQTGFFRPELSPALVTILRIKLPGVVVPPRTAPELARYWQAMGQAARHRLLVYLARHKPTTVVTRQRTLDIVQSVGLALAQAHAAQVTVDIERRIGRTPGLLSLRQITDYHHVVLARFGLPAHAFGGTPLWFVNDGLELELAGDAYGQGSDPEPRPLERPQTPPPSLLLRALAAIVRFLTR